MPGNVAAETDKLGSLPGRLEKLPGVDRRHERLTGEPIQNPDAVFREIDHARLVDLARIPANPDTPLREVHGAPTEPEHSAGSDASEKAQETSRRGYRRLYGSVASRKASTWGRCR